MGRGSEWVRTDLHIHTKGTNKNDQFHSKTMDDFFKIFFKEAKENEVKIIGITDYFSCDNYIRATEELEKIRNNKLITGEEKVFFKDLLLIPNIELRIAPVTGKGKLINIHCLFSPKVIDDLKEDFFCEMKCNGYKMTKKGFISLGRSHLGAEASENECLKAGIERYCINIRDLEKIKNKFGEDILIGVANSSNDGASGIKGHESFYEKKSGSLEEIQRQIYRVSDFIFSGNSKDREYFLGEKMGKQEVTRRCGGLKPCFHGSDAHTEEKLFKPDLEKNCWMKTEITFEGIRQAIYEPEDRVIIQKEKPEQKKNYNIIDKVIFKDENGEKIEIKFNQNLNTIIGGKSTGKSLLLKNLVKNLDEEQLEEKLKDKKDKFPVLEDFQVIWRDEILSDSRNVEYIPQSYLNHIVCEDNKQSEIDRKAREIMLQNQDRKNSLDSLNQDLKSKEIEIEIKIDDYFKLEKENEELEVELKNIGIEDSIKKEIENLKIKLNQLKNKSGLEDSQIKIFSELQESRKELIRQKEKILGKNIELENINIERFICENNLENILNEDLKDKITRILNNSKQELENIIKNNIKKLKEELGNCEKNITEQDTKLEPYLTKLRNEKELKDCEKACIGEEKKLNNIIKLKDQIRINKEENKELKEYILKNLNQYDKIYNSYFQKKIWKEKFDSLDIKAEYAYSIEKWRGIYECLNGTSLRSYTEFSEDKIPTEKEFRKLYDEILKENLRIKRGFNRIEILKKIVRNNNIIKYNITENGNDINSMSEGNKSFVLLEMIIQLGNHEYPIIIDQPEDDLDNRSVYNGLSKFLKNKKKERQIILATHNANIVVGADSENVIVANQDGVNTKNERGIRFNYKNGGLENQEKKETGILNKKIIKEHICEILEGGITAFKSRGKKYHLLNN